MKARGTAYVSLSVCLLIAMAATAFAGEDPKPLAGKTIDKSLAHEGKEYPYKIYLPTGFDGKRSYPVLICLHGLGGKIESFSLVGPAISAQDYLIVTPQAPYPYGPGFSWLSMDKMGRKEPSLELSEKIILAALDDAVENYKGDKDNVFLMGLSQGGHMTYTVGMRHHERFKGLIPCSGSYSANEEIIGDDLKIAKDLPILQTVGRGDKRGDEGLYPRNLEENKTLRKLGYDAMILTYPMGHSLSRLQFQDINTWIGLRTMGRNPTVEILETLERAEEFERLPLIISLAMNDDEEAFAFLENLVEEGKSGDELCAAATGLITNRNGEKADALLRTLLDGDDPQVLKTTIHAIGMRVVEGMAEHLFKLMEDKSEPLSLRREAFLTLQKYGEADKDERMTKLMAVVITAVMDGSQAAEVGLRAGDVVLEYDGIRIESQEQLIEIVRAAADKEQVKMVVARDGGKIEFDLKGGPIGINIQSASRFPEEE